MNSFEFFVVDMFGYEISDWRGHAICDRVSSRNMCESGITLTLGVKKVHFPTKVLLFEDTLQIWNVRLTIGRHYKS